MITDEKRDISIDLAKIVALLGVVGLHTQRYTVTQTLYNPILYYLCRFSMPVFFMINGYLIMNKSNLNLSYCIKKIKNIFGLLSMWSVFGVFFSFFLMNESFFTSLKNGVKVLVGHYIMPSWFLFTFIIIYLFLSMKTFDIIKKNIGKFTILFAFLCVFMHCISIYNIIVNNGYFVQELIPQRYRLWTWLFYFFLGYCIRIYKNDHKNISSKKLFFLWCVLAIIIVIYQYKLCYIYLGKINSGYLYDSPLIMAYSIVTLLLILSIKISDNLKICIQDISLNIFGVFCLHEWINKLFDLNALPNNGMESMILWLGEIVVSYVLAKLVIKHCGKFGKRMMTY